MKKGILFLLLITSVFAKAQSLKDALFSGKLKNQSGTVIRKGDDLSSKMDTAQKAAADTANATAALPGVDSTVQTSSTTTSDTAAGVTAENTNVATDPTNTAAPAATPATNNAIWKTFIDSVASDVKNDITDSKKVKRGNYSVTVTYAIETDGETTINDVFVAPDNDYVKQLVRSRLSADSPRLSPVLNSAGAPRKVIKRQSFTVSKS